MTALVLHYDQNVQSICEATGLATPAPNLVRLLDGARGWCLPPSKLLVLVSPSNYHQRKRFYGDKFVVKPLLFSWSSLSADHLKKLMRVKETDQQLYVAALLDLLRRYQRQAKVPDFRAFISQVQHMCKLPGQAAALGQRVTLLNSLIYESDENADIRSDSSSVLAALQSHSGGMVVVDLTDPLLARDEANGIFQVIVEQFRTAPRKPGQQGGRILALDEAHKFMSGTASDGLSNAIVDVARLMRHDGLRLAVSTQSPASLAPELLELVSVAVLHRFHSRDWFQHLGSKIALEPQHFEQLVRMPPGEALVFAGRHRIVQCDQQHVLPMVMRPRITADRGASRINATVAAAASTIVAISAPASTLLSTPSPKHQPLFSMLPVAEASSASAPAQSIPQQVDSGSDESEEEEVSPKMEALPVSLQAPTPVPSASSNAVVPAVAAAMKLPRSALRPGHTTDADLVRAIRAAIVAESTDGVLGISLLGNAVHACHRLHWHQLAAPRAMRIKEFVMKHPEAFAFKETDARGHKLRDPQVICLD